MIILFAFDTLSILRVVETVIDNLFTHDLHQRFQNDCKAYSIYLDYAQNDTTSHC